MKIDDSFWKYNTRIETTKLNSEIKVHAESETTTDTFESVFDAAKKTSNVTFSKHAVSRMNERDIALSSDEIVKLNNAVEAAEGKGIRDSLILMNSRAFIVNIPSNLVVTVLDSGDINEQKVFTNLDGTVII